MHSRFAILAVVAFILPHVALAQDGIAYRTSKGTLIGTSADGVPRYREDTGWSNSWYSNVKGGLEYSGNLSASPWIVVLQADRTNAAFTANANQLILDLDGKTYSVRPYLVSGSTVRGGQVSIADPLTAGSFLRIQNGTFDNAFGTYSKTLIGNSGTAGRLYVENAHFKTSNSFVGGATNSPGLLVLDAGGQFTAATALFVGAVGNGVVQLNGPGSTLTAGKVDIGSSSTTGSITLNDASSHFRVSKIGSTGGDFSIDNTAPNQPGQNVGLRINAGRVDVEGNLRLGFGAPGRYGAVEINGGTLNVAGNITLASSASETAGGKIFLNSGRLEATSPTTFAPNAQRQFYWKEGTVAYTGPNVSISETQLRALTQQGATSYGGNRAAGVLATGQTLEAAGTLNLSSGSVGLAGGTIRAGQVLNLDASLAGYGTLDVVLQGHGTITNSTTNTIVIGALNGSNTITSAGDVIAGSRNVDATYTGTSSGSGSFVKTGTGTQQITGAIANTGGVSVEAGSLHLNHASLQTSGVTINDGANLRLSGGMQGSATSLLINAAGLGTSAGQLQIEGSQSSLTVAGNVQNGGWIELTDGTLSVAGVVTNHGVISNNGVLDAAINGTGTLTGAGTFSGPVTIESGGVLAPGNSPGAALFTDLTFGAGGTLEFEIADAIGVEELDWDLAVVSNALSITATAANPFTIVLKSLGENYDLAALANFDPERSYAWRFVSTSIGSPGTFDVSSIVLDTAIFDDWNADRSAAITVSAASDGLYLNYNAAPASAPEPNSMILSALAGGLLGARRLRQWWQLRRCERTTAA